MGCQTQDLAFGIEGPDRRNAATDEFFLSNRGGLDLGGLRWPVLLKQGKSAVRYGFVVTWSDVDMAGGFWLLPGPFLDRRNRRPEEQRDKDAIGEWFH